MSRLAPASQWTVLIVLSVGIGAVLLWLHAPAALMLGPLVAGIVIASGGGKVRFPLPAFVVAQGIIGCMIARMVPLSILGDILSHWLLFTAGVLSVVAACSLIGWLMTRLHLLPGTTALWGMSPGAASVMTIMAESYGADIRLVAVMQYLRVVGVAAVASLVAKLFGVSAAHCPPAAHSRRRVPGAAGGWRRADPSRLADNRAADLAFSGKLRVRRLEHRPAFHASIAHACRARLATHCRLHAGADRHLRRRRCPDGRGRRDRSADGLPRHQPWRLGFDCHHRGIHQCRRILRDGHADVPHDHRLVHRSRPDQIHRQTDQCVRPRCVVS